MVKENWIKLGWWWRFWGGFGRCAECRHSFTKAGYRSVHKFYHQGGGTDYEYLCESCYRCWFDPIPRHSTPADSKMAKALQRHKLKEL